MADRTGIEWTDATWNPVTGCTEVSPGCDHCYAKTFAERWRGTPGHHFERGFDLTLRPERLDQPLRWRRPRRVFVNSMSDLFHRDVPEEFIARVFATMAAARRHTFQVLTKRHARMRALLDSDTFADRALNLSDALFPVVVGERPHGDTWPLPNVWLGVSVENQQWADIRIPALLDTPAAVRFLSCEPLLGPVDLSRWLKRVQRACERCCPAGRLDFASAHLWGTCGCACHPSPPARPDWVIVGGESGPSARPMDPAWARHLRDQCTAAGVPFLFKQWGAWRPASVIDRPARPSRYVEDPAPMVRVGKHAAGRVLDGQTWNELPEAVTR